MGIYRRTRKGRGPGNREYILGFTVKEIAGASGKSEYTIRKDIRKYGKRFKKDPTSLLAYLSWRLVLREEEEM